MFSMRRLHTHAAGISAHLIMQAKPRNGAVLSDPPIISILSPPSNPRINSVKHVDLTLMHQKPTINGPEKVNPPWIR